LKLQLLEGTIKTAFEFRHNDPGSESNTNASSNNGYKAPSSSQYGSHPEGSLNLGAQIFPVSSVNDQVTVGQDFDWNALLDFGSSTAECLFDFESV
jgi:hypothetical protein